LFQQYPAKNATYNSGGTGHTNSAAVWLAIAEGDFKWAPTPGSSK